MSKLQRKFNWTTVEVRERVSNHITYSNIDVITHQFFMLNYGFHQSWYDSEEFRLRDIFSVQELNSDLCLRWVALWKQCGKWGTIWQSLGYREKVTDSELIEKSNLWWKLKDSFSQDKLFPLVLHSHSWQLRSMNVWRIIHLKRLDQ